MHCNAHDISNFSTLFGWFISLVQVEIHAICLYVQVIEALKCLIHQDRPQTMPEIVKVDAYQLLLREFLWTNKSEPSAMNNEVGDAFRLILLHFDELQYSYPS